MTLIRPAVAALAFCAGASLLTAQAPPPLTPMAEPKTPVERGAYLVTLGGCNDCHTPFKMGPHGPEPDMTRMLSGHPQSLTVGPVPAAQGVWIAFASATFTAWAGPWGISYSPNLTPDPTTGLPSKGMTEERFIRAMRTGQHLGGGRPILPPMPWPNVGLATDADLKAIYAFLKSVPPIKNAVPESVPAPPPPAR